MNTRDRLIASAIDSNVSDGDGATPSSISAQCLTWYAEDVEDCNGSDDDDSDNSADEDGSRPQRSRDTSRYRIHMFGVSKCGRSVHAEIDGAQPRFYLRSRAGSFSALRQWLYEIAGSYVRIEDVEIVHRMNFWGFNNHQKEPFAMLTFRSLRGMRVLASSIQKKIDTGNVPHGLRPLELFESNVDPILRFFHEHQIQPAGWVDVDAEKLARRGSKKREPLTTRLHAHIQLPQRSHRGPSLEIGIRPSVSTSNEDMAPLVIASFDLECDSLHGDFPVPIKDYRRLALDVDNLWEVGGKLPLKQSGSEYDVKKVLMAAMDDAFFNQGSEGLAHALAFSHTSSSNRDRVRMLPTFNHVADDMYAILKQSQKLNGSTNRVEKLLSVLNKAFMHAHPLKGDSIIQIGVTAHVYGQQHASSRAIFVLGSCTEELGDDDDTNKTVVHTFESEADLICAWADYVGKDLDPDILTGYNIFGFDFSYLHERATALDVDERICDSLTRLSHAPGKLVVREMSSSALGDNVLKYIDAPGRVLIDLMKIVQRDHRLDSYKLDAVARHFTGEAKDDVSPKDIFRLQKGSAEDRAIIARYCVQDCALCNLLVAKLEILANNVGMANVCWVPLSYIFMRGQGVKIFSLVSKQCLEDGFVIPTKRYVPPQSFGEGVDEEDGYEGAIVLEPETGMYLDTPVSVLDYNSLYPSSMISENISHDTIVLDKEKYGSLPGVDYVEISTTDTQVCRFAQSRKGVLPCILEALLQRRKQTRYRATHVRVSDAATNETVFVGQEKDWEKKKLELEDAKNYKIEPAYTNFQRAVLDGLQLAYKTTANSLYGQMGARTSPLYLRDVAACTTATGRAMIMLAKNFIEREFQGHVVYGDTDSLFVVFPSPDNASHRDRLATSIRAGQDVSREIHQHLKKPHNLEYEKTLFPLILLSKKRYVGLLYENDPDEPAPKQKSMGIALKRRDYAQVVKRVYGGVIDIVLTRRDVPAAVSFLRDRLRELAAGRTPLEELVISKTLKSHYKFPAQIAHAVLARRMYERDPGSAPQVNDRIPYVFVETTKKNALMGERIEHVDFVRANPEKVRIDAKMYIENQLMKPCTQLLAIALEQIPGYTYRVALSGRRALSDIADAKNGDVAKARERLNTLREREVERLVFTPVLASDDVRRSVNRCNGQREISSFFSVSSRQ